MEEAVLITKVILSIRAMKDAIKAAGWSDSSTSIMIHDVDLKQVKAFYGDKVILESGLIEEEMRTYISAKIDGIDGLTLFGKEEK